MKESKGADERSRRQPVLTDHKRVKKRLIPPFVDQIPLVETSWVKDLVPEVIWIALLIDSVGLQRGVELAKSMSCNASGLRDSFDSEPFAFISKYSGFRQSEMAQLRQGLANAGMLSDIQRALQPLLFYTDCPLNFLLQGMPVDSNLTQTQMAVLRRVVADNMPRRDRAAILTKSVVVYITATSGKLVFTKDAPPPNLESLVAYPDTEESLRVAASVGATVTGIINMITDNREWPSYFWNHGLTNDPCTLEDITT